MSKKSMMREAVDAAKGVAGAALGAAAVAATGVVMTSVASAIRKSSKQLDDATPQIQKLASNTVSKPLLPQKRKRAAAPRKAKSAKRKVAVKKAMKKRRAKR